MEEYSFTLRCTDTVGWRSGHGGVRTRRTHGSCGEGEGVFVAMSRGHRREFDHAVGTMPTIAPWMWIALRQRNGAGLRIDHHL